MGWVNAFNTQQRDQLTLEHSQYHPVVHVDLSLASVAGERHHVRLLSSQTLAIARAGVSQAAENAVALAYASRVEDGHARFLGNSRDSRIDLDVVFERGPGAGRGRVVSDHPATQVAEGRVLSGEQRSGHCARRIRTLRRHSSEEAEAGESRD